MSSIKRIGIVLKPHQPEALKTICELVVWLAERNITLVGGPEIERERYALKALRGDFHDVPPESERSTRGRANRALDAAER